MTANTLGNLAQRPYGVVASNGNAVAGYGFQMFAHPARTGSVTFDAVYKSDIPTSPAPTAVMDVRFVDQAGVVTFLQFSNRNLGSGTYMLSWTGNVTGSMTVTIPGADVLPTWLRFAVTMSTFHNNVTFRLWHEHGGTITPVVQTRPYSHSAFVGFGWGKTVTTPATLVDEIAYWHEINPQTTGICTYPLCLSNVTRPTPTANVLFYHPGEGTQAYSSTAPNSGYMAGPTAVGTSPASFRKAFRPSTGFRHGNFGFSTALPTRSFTHAAFVSGDYIQFDMIVYRSGIAQAFYNAVNLTTYVLGGTGASTTIIQFEYNAGSTKFSAVAFENGTNNANCGLVTTSTDFRVVYTRTQSAGFVRSTLYCRTMTGGVLQAAFDLPFPYRWPQGANAVDITVYQPPSNGIALDELSYTVNAPYWQGYGICVWNPPL